MDFTQLITDGIHKVLTSHTEVNLGDRSVYVGSSDIAGCLRKAYFRKTDSRKDTQQTLIHFLRGHIAEEIIAQALVAQGFNAVRQFEARHPNLPYLKSHIDFLFRRRNGNGTSTLAVLEVKSVMAIPNVPYESWTRQLAYQLALLSTMEPTCSCYGSILCFDIAQGQIKLFDPLYAEGTVSLASMLIERGILLYKAMKGEIPPDELPVEPGPLCGYCQYREGCPGVSIDGDAVLDLSPISDVVRQYVEVKEEQDLLKQRQDDLREQILAFLGSSQFGRCQHYVVQKTVSSVSRLDTNAIKKNYPDIYKEFTKTTEQTRLTVKEEGNHGKEL